MKLLFDENLSRKLVARLAQAFPGSKHINELGFDEAGDEVIWNYAQKNGFAIVSKDSDFHQKSLLYSEPPKVIWIKKGNCSTDEIFKLLECSAAEIRLFLAEPETTFLVLE